MDAKQSVKISTEQARVLATAIYPLISSYIREHKADYEAWLEEQDDTTT